MPGSVDPSAPNIQTLWANKIGGWNSDGLALFVNSYNTSDQQLRLETGNGTIGTTANTASGAVSYGQWHRLSAAIDQLAGVARLLHVDGIDRTVSSSVQNDFGNQKELDLGRFIDNAFFFKGVLDEVRIEKGFRSPDWVKASWLSSVPMPPLPLPAPVNARPALSVSQTSTQAVISGFANAGYFELYETTNLAPPAVWIPVTNDTTYVTGQWQVIIPVDLTDSARFFRLQQ